MSLYNCKNNHKFDDMSINEFINSQKIDVSEMICHICKEKK